MLGFLARPSLKLDVPEVLFLPATSPTESKILQGSVTLTLTRPGRLPPLSIELLGVSELAMPNDPPLRLEVLKRRIAISEMRMLDAGPHIYRFELEIPVQTSPSVVVSTGRIWYCLRAVAEAASRTGHDLIEQREILLVFSPGEDNEAPPGVDYRVLEASEETGDYAFGVWSPSLALGGLIALDFSFTSLRQLGNTPLEIIWSVRQQVELRANGKVHRLEPTDIELRRYYQLDKNPTSKARLATGVPLCPPVESKLVVNFNPDGSRRFNDIIFGIPENCSPSRLPNHLEMQSSTPEHVLSAIRVSHECRLQMLYKNRQGKGRLITVARPIAIASCFCMVETLRLPVYSRVQGRHHLRKGVQCICSQSLEELTSEYVAEYTISLYAK